MTSIPSNHEKRVVEQTRDLSATPSQTEKTAPSASETISPVPSFDETMRKDAQDGDIKYTSTVNEKDLEINGTSSVEEGSGEEFPRTRSQKFMARYGIYVHAIIWVIMTG